MSLPVYQVDAFTDRLFGGNPAAVCPLPCWLPDETMQAIATENNLSETAFFVRDDDHFAIRWFTPAVEVDLCGHATLASAHVIFRFVEPDRRRVVFSTRRAGLLTVARQGDDLTLDFPAQPPTPHDASDALSRALGASPGYVLVVGGFRYLAVFDTEAQIRELQPDLRRLAALDRLGVIVTAPGSNGIDFVSRYFAPGRGIDEDPVTGSAHCTLAPYWAGRLGRKRLVAKQVSARGGDLVCELAGDRVLMTGRARLFLEGRIHL